MMTDPTQRLLAAIAAVCPVDSVTIGSWSDSGTWSFTPSVGATAQQIAAGQAALAAFNPTPPTPVPLLTLVQAITALTTNQKNLIWTDLGTGSPAKWTLDVGPNAAAVAIGQLLGTLTGLNAADSLSAKIRTVAIYVQDNPTYLVHPAFDPTINIPGQQ